MRLIVRCECRESVSFISSLVKTRSLRAIEALDKLILIVPFSASAVGWQLENLHKI